MRFFLKMFKTKNFNEYDGCTNIKQKSSFLLFNVSTPIIANHYTIIANTNNVLN